MGVSDYTAAERQARRRARLAKLADDNKQLKTELWLLREAVQRKGYDPDILIKEVREGAMII